eukprot:SAG31_NODE_242_length_19350_cov_3.043998_8_plen_124_part_00
MSSADDAGAGGSQAGRSAQENALHSYSPSYYSLQRGPVREWMSDNDSMGSDPESLQTIGSTLGSGAKKLAREANVAHRAKKYEKAAELYTQAIELGPPSWTLLSNRALTYLKLLDYDAAFQVC